MEPPSSGRMAAKPRRLCLSRQRGSDGTAASPAAAPPVSPCVPLRSPAPLAASALLAAVLSPPPAPARRRKPSGSDSTGHAEPGHAPSQTARHTTSHAAENIAPRSVENTARHNERAPPAARSPSVPRTSTHHSNRFLPGDANTPRKDTEAHDARSVAGGEASQQVLATPPTPRQLVETVPDSPGDTVQAPPPAQACPLCGSEFGAAQDEAARTRHVEACLRNSNTGASAGEAADCAVPTADSAAKAASEQHDRGPTCAVCGVGLRGLPLAERTAHVNACLDGTPLDATGSGVAARDGARGNAANAKQPARKAEGQALLQRQRQRMLEAEGVDFMRVNMCPCCSTVFKASVTSKARAKHVKTCARKNSMAPADVIVRARELAASMPSPLDSSGESSDLVVLSPSRSINRRTVSAPAVGKRAKGGRAEQPSAKANTAATAARSSSAGGRRSADKAAAAASADPPPLLQATPDMVRIRAAKRARMVVKALRPTTALAAASPAYASIERCAPSSPPCPSFAVAASPLWRLSTGAAPVTSGLYNLAPFAAGTASEAALPKPDGLTEDEFGMAHYSQRTVASATPSPVQSPRGSVRAVTPPSAPLAPLPTSVWRLARADEPRVDLSAWLLASALADIQLDVDGVRLPAHRLALTVERGPHAASSSPLLATCGDPTAAQHHISVTGATPEQMRCALAFVYTGTCLWPSAEAPALVAVARLLDVPSLTKAANCVAADVAPTALQTTPCSCNAPVTLGRCDSSPIRNASDCTGPDAATAALVSPAVSSVAFAASDFSPSLTGQGAEAAASPLPCSQDLPPSGLHGPRDTKQARTGDEKDAAPSAVASTLASLVTDSESEEEEKEDTVQAVALHQRAAASDSDMDEEAKEDTVQASRQAAARDVESEEKEKEKEKEDTLQAAPLGRPSAAPHQPDTVFCIVSSSEDEAEDDAAAVIASDDDLDVDLPAALGSAPAATARRHSDDKPLGTASSRHSEHAMHDTDDDAIFAGATLEGGASQGSSCKRASTNGNKQAASGWESDCDDEDDLPAVFASRGSQPPPAKRPRSGTAASPTGDAQAAGSKEQPLVLTSPREPLAKTQAAAPQTPVAVPQLTVADGNASLFAPGTPQDPLSGVALVYSTPSHPSASLPGLDMGISAAATTDTALEAEAGLTKTVGAGQVQAQQDVELAASSTTAATAATATTAATKAEELARQLVAVVRNDEALYSAALGMEAFPLTALKDAATAAGLRCSRAVLVDFCDSQGLTWTAPRKRVAPRAGGKKRRKKRPVSTPATALPD